MVEKDTIVANATPLIPSAVGIVRISGEKALSIGKKLFSLPENLEERKVYFGKITDRKGDVIDEGLFVFFKAPRSFTGEDIVEIFPHGSVPVIKKIIEEAIFFGARIAEPGEFTKRAFLNGKIDLTQAEAIADLIEAKTEKASKAAVNLLEGKLSKKVKELRDTLLELVSLIEAEINFPEDVEEIDPDLIKANLEKVIMQIENLMKTYRQGQLIREGIKLAIVGKPNVGKSSLFNALIGYERAIVSNIKGTTRDFIEERLIIKGIPVKLLDTAGIRKTEDKIEKIGIQKALEKVNEADIVIFVFDASEGIDEQDLEIFEKIKNKNPIIVGNKSDLILDKNKKKYYFKDVILVSSKTLKNLDLLEEKILQELNLLEESDTDVYINLRHYESFKKAKDILSNIIKNFEFYIDQKEILMLEISEAEKNLEEITGQITTEDVLGNIFGKFCIGK
ncbi:tRNA uridine-5-carboxymethylaminomethyl(34) synthesis GTPase MnmE [Persephonella sp.]|uniref:tRNA uridine-5-carboxymethylaminomethyl(34) synthesis GTPase MnmE n=2 Tax=Persephonella sp. TaxID=2060922 RepID=UPI0025D5BD02|nr:tRNA uridine-5-carboxymethylaminomethyl(34) synthesis GTPase MnmE [Persephonella sp.]